MFSLQYTHDLSLNRRLPLLAASETVLFGKIKYWVLHFHSEAARVTLYASS